MSAAAFELIEAAERLVGDKPFKVCSCGKKYGVASFASLPYPVSGYGLTTNYEGGLFYWRNCTACGSTICVEFDRHGKQVL